MGLEGGPIYEFYEADMILKKNVRAVPLPLPLPLPPLPPPRLPLPLPLPLALAVLPELDGGAKSSNPDANPEAGGAGEANPAAMLPARGAKYSSTVTAGGSRVEHVMGIEVQACCW